MDASFARALSAGLKRREVLAAFAVPMLGPIVGKVPLLAATLDLPDGVAALVWSHAPDPARRPAPVTAADVPSVTAESTAMAKDLKRHGFRFVGPTTAYALMQACGLVNDHLEGCAFRDA